MPNAGHYRKALERASILWEYYEEHGRLLIVDVNQLLRQPYRSVYLSFVIHHISAPLVWDSHKEKIKRKADLLIEMAKMLKRDQLTEYQASIALKVKPSCVHMILYQIDKHNIPIPEITGQKETECIDEEIEYTISRTDEDYYPAGLQVMDSRPGPNGKTIYRIR